MSVAKVQVRQRINSSPSVPEPQAVLNLKQNSSWPNYANKFNFIPKVAYQMAVVIIRRYLITEEPRSQVQTVLDVMSFFFYFVLLFLIFKSFLREGPFIK